MQRTDLDLDLLKRPVGRPRAKPEIEPFVMPDGMTVVDFLEGVAMGTIKAPPSQIAAAKTVAQYKHVRLDRGGKKDAQQREAEAAQQSTQFDRRSLGMPAQQRPALKLVVNG